MSVPPNPFQKVAEGVPIIGQPVTIGGWFPTVLVTCNCEAKQPLLLVGLGNPSLCPSCGRGFRLLGVQVDVRNEQPPHFNIDIMLPGPRAVDSPKPS